MPPAIGAVILGQALAGTVVLGSGATALTLGSIVGYAVLTAACGPLQIIRARRAR